MHDTGLASRLRARGVSVVEIAGWQTRGSDDFAPRGAVNHHTAGSPNGAAPSLAICIYGRSDLPGPLAQVLLGRDLVAYVIAAGRANHAGPGGWRGLTGNRSVHGLEIEHVGSGPSPTQLTLATRIHVAFLEAPGSSGDPDLVCQHFEWAPSRKIDFRELNPPYTPDTFRAAVSAQMEDDMPLTAADEATFKKWTREAVAEQLDSEARRVEGITTYDQVLELTYEYARAASKAATPAQVKAALLDVAPAFAAAVVAELPPGGVTDAQIEAAVKRALASAVGRMEFTDAAVAAGD